jgi:hypothetical protein
MGVPVAALEQMSARELTEWRVFEEGFGPLTIQERIDHLAAQVSYYLSGEGQLADFMPRWVVERKGSFSIVDWLSAKAQR